mmetsp:Transcript_9453/g.10681  ORF Transcript_9453/g.10681 Transcript_9453/m.10681 type:complete len:83 (+) Transcript_9453:620-868(+)
MLIVSWFVRGGCMFIQKFIDNGKSGTMNFRRAFYFNIKSIEYFLEFIHQMYTLIYIKSVSTLILFFAVLNLIIVIIGTIYNY